LEVDSRPGQIPREAGREVDVVLYRIVNSGPLEVLAPKLWAIEVEDKEESAEKEGYVYESLPYGPSHFGALISFR